jgi:hypothetical protein
MPFKRANFRLGPKADIGTGDRPPPRTVTPMPLRALLYNSGCNYNRLPE